jgi:hypothetical protein
MKVGDRLKFKNYWDSRDSGTAVVIDVEDTIFQPFDEQAEEDLAYTIKDEETGREFEVDDDDYYVELI